MSHDYDEVIDYIINKIRANKVLKEEIEYEYKYNNIEELEYEDIEENLARRIYNKSNIRRRKTNKDIYVCIDEVIEQEVIEQKQRIAPRLSEEEYIRMNNISGEAVLDYLVQKGYDPELVKDYFSKGYPKTPEEFISALRHRLTYVLDTQQTEIAMGNKAQARSNMGISNDYEEDFIIEMAQIKEIIDSGELAASVREELQRRYDRLLAEYEELFGRKDEGRKPSHTK